MGFLAAKKVEFLVDLKIMWMFAEKKCFLDYSHDLLNSTLVNWTSLCTAKLIFATLLKNISFFSLEKAKKKFIFGTKVNYEVRNRFYG